MHSPDKRATSCVTLASHATGVSAQRAQPDDLGSLARFDERVDLAERNELSHTWVRTKDGKFQKVQVPRCVLLGLCLPEISQNDLICPREVAESAAARWYGVRNGAAGMSGCWRVVGGRGIGVAMGGVGGVDGIRARASMRRLMRLMGGKVVRSVGHGG